MDKPISFDLLQELNDLHMRIIFSTAFGQDMQNVKLPYI